MNTLEHESDEFENDLRIFKESLRAAAERPDAFWTSQRAHIAAKVQPAVPALRLRLALVWAPAAIVVGLCLFLFVQSSKAPTPDFATGADQNLLVEIEQALKQKSPDALAPAALIAGELERAGKNNEDPLMKKRSR
jgi:hypothetical protein